MLFTLGLLLLLTPFPSIQTTTNEKRDFTGSDISKPNAALTSSKPKTTAAPAKQILHSSLKPNADNKTILTILTSNQKPTVNTSKTTKIKPVPTVIQPTLSTSTKPTAAMTNKDKLRVSVNQTVIINSHSNSDVKTKDKPPSNVQKVQSISTKSTTPSSTKITKVKPTAFSNQTFSNKPPSFSSVKTTKDKAGSAVAQNVPSTTTSSVVKTSKDKPSASVNQTVSTKNASTSDVKMSKDKPATTLVKNALSTSTKPAIASGTLTNKVKLTALVNQTARIKSHATGDVRATKSKFLLKPKTAQSSATYKGNTTASVVQTVTIKSRTAGDVKTTENKMVLSPTTPSSSTTDKDNTTASVNQTVEIQPSISRSVKTTKDKDEASQPNKLVISNDCDSKGELTVMVKPGPPLVMTHQISLVPGGCTGGCDAEMAALKGRVARLEKEMSSLKENCSCSANCPNDCSGNGKCEKGKCVCFQGFLGPDCISESAKGKINMQATQDSNTTREKTQGKNTTTERTVFLKKEQKVGNEAKESDTKTKVTPVLKVDSIKPSVKLVKASASVRTTSPSTVSQTLLKHKRRKQEEARNGKATVLTPKDHLPKTDIKQEKNKIKHTELKDEPQTNVTHGTVNKSNGTDEVQVTLKVAETSSNKTGKHGTLEQSTLTGKNITQSFGNKLSKVEKVNTPVIQSVDSTKTKGGKTGKGKVPQRSVYIVNVTTEEATSDESKVLQNKTVVQSSGSTGRSAGGSGLGSVKVANVTSHRFTLTWSAPQGMFKNFTVIRREHREDSEEDGDEDVEEGVLQSEKANGTTVSTKVSVTRGRPEGKRVSMVHPGNVRSVQVRNLRSQTRYTLHIFGSAPGKRSKVHRVTVTTGPEPATELVFSNVTESSLTVSWSKPKSTLSGFRVTYTYTVTGESNFVTVDSQQSHVVLSKLSAGSSYVISVITTKGKAQSDALTSTITTVPAPPTHLQAINITDTRAVLQWTPSLGTVDRFIISYESSKTPNMTVTVMVSGNSVEHHLRGLHRGTLYTIKVLSQKDRVQSTTISTSFTTADVVKASEVGARSAVITWKAPTVAYHSYRLTFQVAGEETKEVILDSTVTEYKLTGLFSMTRYIVLVEGERDGHYTSVVTTEFLTGNLHFAFPTDCSQELLNGELHSGEVDIFPYGKEGGAIRVYCDMETDGGGWTVFQRRMNGELDFYRTWNEYAAGFGNLSKEFWLGNELLHNLTNMGPVSLRVDMRAGNDTAYAHYHNFTIDTEEKHYTIMLSGYTGTAGDSMRYHNGRPFSSRDKNPDPLGINCSRNYMGGWWYKNCYKTNLNGLYGKNSNNQGVVWIDWKGKDSSIPFTEMKFRPTGFLPETHG